jgi:hypothetical protein
VTAGLKAPRHGSTGTRTDAGDDCERFHDSLLRGSQVEQISREVTLPQQPRASISAWPTYFCVWAGALALGVDVTDIDTLP